ncbi:MAG: ATPase [Nitrospirales bacterium]|nr:ATPase [Nitrospirales bacterium]
MSKSLQRTTFVFLFLTVVIAGFSLSNVSTAQAAQPDPSRSVFVNLFEWKWSDVARECETYLGPKGFAAVQISPPQEHVVLPSDGYPWWQNYQPVSYKIESRMGSRSDFQDMVSRCNAVGVNIYADVVINHMAAGSGTGSAGSIYSNNDHWYAFPGIYQGQDFHWNVSGTHNCQGSVDNYQNQHAVQDCELVGLPDLATETSYVRDRIADYLKDLYSLGVRGFRIDAAKHMDAGDVSAIFANFKGKIGNRSDYYVVQEVIDPGTEAVKKEWYYSNGDVNDFTYGQKLKEQFMNWNGQHISNLRTFGQDWGLAKTDKAVPFIDNHDMQRGEKSRYLTSRDNGNHFSYTLANVFMLAWPFGYPQLMSSYAFSDDKQGPPTNGNGTTKSIYGSSTSTTPDCFSSTSWLCEHRWREIGNMVSFRNAAGSNAVANWWDNGNNQIALGRGNKGFVIINREDSVLNRDFQTGLAAGAYCDIIAGDWDGSSCSGRTITVNDSGWANISVPANYAAAIHVMAKVKGSTPLPVQATFNITVPSSTASTGRSVFIAGDLNKLDPPLSFWNPVGLKMTQIDSTHWTVTVTATQGTTIQYKYALGDWGFVEKNQNCSEIQNRSITLSSNGQVVNDTVQQWRNVNPCGN